MRWEWTLFSSIIVLSELWRIHVPGVANLDRAIVKTPIRIGHARKIVETILKGIGKIGKNPLGVIPSNLIFTIARNTTHDTTHDTIHDTIHEMIETMTLIDIQGLLE